YWLRHGRITPHEEIRSLQGREVEFVDGSRRVFDLIGYATGYHASIPFLQKGIVKFEDDVPNLAAGLFPLGQRNLYVFGIGKILPIPRYGVGPPITAGAELLVVKLMKWLVPKMPALEKWIFWNERRPTEGETVERGAA